MTAINLDWLNLAKGCEDAFPEYRQQYRLKHKGWWFIVAADGYRLHALRVDDDFDVLDMASEKYTALFKYGEILATDTLTMETLRANIEENKAYGDWRDAITLVVNDVACTVFERHLEDALSGMSGDINLTVKHMIDANVLMLVINNDKKIALLGQVRPSEK